MSDTINFKVWLFHKEKHEEEAVIVERVHYEDYLDYYVRLTGTDPSCYPEWAQGSSETRKWVSKDLSLLLKKDDPVEISGVKRTDEDVPEPEVTY